MAGPSGEKPHAFLDFLFGLAELALDVVIDIVT